MHKKKVLKIVGLTILLVLLTALATEGPLVKFFMSGTPDDVLEIILIPLTMMSIVSLPILFTLYFLSEPRFNSWLKLTKRYVPISIAVIALFPGIDGSMTGFDRELMTWFSTGLYFLLSVIAIARRPKLG